MDAQLGLRPRGRTRRQGDQIQIVSDTDPIDLYLERAGISDRQTIEVMREYLAHYDPSDLIERTPSPSSPSRLCQERPFVPKGEGQNSRVHGVLTGLLDNSIEHLDLPLYDVTTEGLFAVIQGVQHNTSLVSLKLSYGGADKFTDYVLKAFGFSLSSHPLLESVVLSHCGLNHNAAIMFSRVLLQSPSITSLELTNSKLGEESAGEIAKVMALVPRFKSLDLSFNPIGSKGLEALLASKSHLSTLILESCGIDDKLIVTRIPITLEVLDLSNNSIGGLAAVWIASQIFKTRAVHTLNFSGNAITYEASTALALCIEDSNLKQVNLSRNLLNASAMQTIFDSVLKSSTLQTFSASGNDISCAISDGEVIRARSNLQKLHLRKCGLSVPDLSKLSRLFEENELLDLDLSENDIDDEGASALANLEASRMNLNNNEITERGAITLIDGKCRSSGGEILLFGNEVPEEYVLLLSEPLAQTSDCCSVNLSN